MMGVQTVIVEFLYFSDLSLLTRGHGLSPPLFTGRTMLLLLPLLLLSLLLLLLPLLSPGRRGKYRRGFQGCDLVKVIVKLRDADG